MGTKGFENEDVILAMKTVSLSWNKWSRWVFRSSLYESSLLSFSGRLRSLGCPRESAAYIANSNERVGLRIQSVCRADTDRFRFSNLVWTKLGSIGRGTSCQATACERSIASVTVRWCCSVGVAKRSTVNTCCDNPRRRRTHEASNRTGLSKKFQVRRTDRSARLSNRSLLAASGSIEPSSDSMARQQLFFRLPSHNLVRRPEDFCRAFAGRSKSASACVPDKAFG